MFEQAPPVPGGVSVMATAQEHALRVVSPLGRDGAPAPIELAAPLGELTGKHVILLSNQKQNMDLLLRRLGTRLRREGAHVSERRKPSASMGAGPLIRELSARAHGVVTGMGD
jgi:hypothetical protein